MLRANCKFIIGGKKAWLPRLKDAVFYLNMAAANDHEALTRSITAAVSRAVSEALNASFSQVSQQKSLHLRFYFSVSNKTQLCSDLSATGIKIRFKLNLGRAKSSF